MLYIESHLKQQFQELLEHDERLIWAGVPKKGLIFGTHDKFLIPFSMAWCTIVTVWMIFVLDASIPFALFGIPFVLIGLFLLVGRFILGTYLRSRTFYGLTTKRLIINVKTKRPLISSYDLKEITQIELTEFKDETGTITFYSSSKNTSNAEKTVKLVYPSSQYLFKIKNATNAKVQLLRAQKEQQLTSNTE